MGEPLGNYKNVLKAVRRLNTELGIGARHITISTVGLAPRIKRLADEGEGCVEPYRTWWRPVRRASIHWSRGIMVGWVHGVMVGLSVSLTHPTTGLQIKLALSLHAANDRERSRLIPANKRFNLNDVMDSIRYYVDKTGRRSVGREYSRRFCAWGRGGEPYAVGGLEREEGRGLTGVPVLPIEPGSLLPIVFSMAFSAPN